MKSVGEEYQVVMRGREYLFCGEEYNVERRENGSNTTFPTILKLSIEISNKEGDVQILGKKIKM